MAGINGYNTGLDEDNINKHYQSQLENNKKSADASGSDVKDIQHKTASSNGNYNSLFSGSLMSWTKILESLNEVSTTIAQNNVDMTNDSLGEVPSSFEGNDEDREKQLLDELNQIFTPILVMQGFEGDMSDQIREAFEEASVLTEKNIIKFDDATRMAQLISVCALLIEKQKNTPEYQTYQKAATIRNQTKINIEKKNYDEAKALAQKYLVKVSTTNNSSIARSSATDLLPETQH